MDQKEEKQLFFFQVNFSTPKIASFFEFFFEKVTVFQPFFLIFFFLLCILCTNNKWRLSKQESRFSKMEIAPQQKKGRALASHEVAPFDHSAHIIPHAPQTPHSRRRSFFFHLQKIHQSFHNLEAHFKVFSIPGDRNSRSSASRQKEKETFNGKPESFFWEY